MAELRARRGGALSLLALCAQARAEFEAALATMSSDSSDELHRRAEVHCEISTACLWLLDTVAIEQHARAALHLAEQVHSPELQLAARPQLTNVQSARGQVDDVLAEGRRLVANLSDPTLRQRFLASQPAATARRFS